MNQEHWTPTILKLVAHWVKKEFWIWCLMTYFHCWGLTCHWKGGQTPQASILISSHSTRKLRSILIRWLIYRPFFNLEMYQIWFRRILRIQPILERVLRFHLPHFSMVCITCISSNWWLTLKKMKTSSASSGKVLQAKQRNLPNQVMKNNKNPKKSLQKSKKYSMVYSTLNWLKSKIKVNLIYNWELYFQRNSNIMILNTKRSSKYIPTCQSSSK